MSSTMAKFGKITWVGMFDLVTGVTIAEIMNAVFPRKVLPNQPTWEQIFYLIFEIFLQGILTLFVGEEIRSFFLGDAFEDPTGGILFILSVFRQPGFWARVDSVSSVLSAKIRGWFSGAEMEDRSADYIPQN